MIGKNSKKLLSQYEKLTNLDKVTTKSSRVKQIIYSQNRYGVRIVAFYLLIYNL